MTSSSLESCIKWFGSLPYAEQVTIINAAINGRTELLEPKIGKDNMELLNSLITHLKSGITSETLQQECESYGLERSTILLLTSALIEISKKPSVEDAMALQKIPVDTLRKILGIYITEYVEKSAIDPEDYLLKNFNLSKADVEKIGRAFRNYFRFAIYYTVEGLTKFLMEQGLDEERTKLISESIASHIATIRTWCLLDKLDDIDSELEKIKEDNEVLKKGFGMLSNNLKETLNFLKRIFRGIVHF